MIVNKKKGYYKNNKEKLREQARDKYRNLPEEEKIKKREDGKNSITICLKKKKQKLKQYQKEYQKKYREARKIILYTNKINNELLCRL